MKLYDASSLFFHKKKSFQEALKSNLSGTIDFVLWKKQQNK